MKYGEKEHHIGELDDDGYDITFVPKRSGYLKIYKHPESGYVNRYIVSSDPAAGLSGGDSAIMNVLDRLDNEFVATAKLFVDELEQAEIMTLIGLYYNEAFLIPERNMRTLINILKPGGITPYPGEIYIQHIVSRGEHDYGYYTHHENRPVLLKYYRGWLKKYGYDKLSSLDTIEEHKKFERKPGGLTAAGNIKREVFAAAEGYTDDDVLSKALCVEGDRYLIEEGVDIEYNPEMFEKQHEEYKQLTNVVNVKNTGVRQSSMGQRDRYRVNDNDMKSHVFRSVNLIHNSRRQSNLGRR